MKVVPIKTHKITYKDKNIFKVLDKYVRHFEEKSVLAVASKIISICEGSIIKINKIERDELILKQAHYYLPRSSSKYNMFLTIKDNIIIPAAGIDESNGAGYYILWPKNSQETANKIREYLCRRFKIKYAGVVIIDSKTTPLRWGTTGIALAHSGFLGLNDYIGKRDIFGREMQMTKANIMDSLAAASILAMGEGSEQTPIVVIEDLSFVKFQSRNLTKKELEDLHINIDDDIYAPILKSVNWQKGRA